MRNQKSPNRFISLLLLTAPFWLASCSNDQAVNSAPMGTQYDLPTVMVEVRQVDIPYISTGSVISDSKVQVTSRIAGYIRNIAVKEGEKVKKGQLLISLDESDVEGAISQLTATVAKARVALNDAETDVVRYEALYKRGSASENMLRKVCLQRDVAKDSLHEAEAGLKTATSQRSYIRIISPVAGCVVSRQKQEGDLAVPGIPILTVESTDELLFETFVPESIFGYLKPDSPVQVKIDAISEFLQGSISRIVPSGDPVTRRYQIKIVLPETAGLLPGMFGRADFVIGKETSPIIPQSSMVVRGGLEGVFLVDEKNLAHFRWIRTGREWQGYLQISSGLKGGECIIAVPETNLRDGDMIKTGEVNHEG